MVYLIRKIRCCRRKQRTLLVMVVGLMLIYFSAHVTVLTPTPVSAMNKLGETLVLTTVRPAEEKPACREKRNFVFIKQMKCATSTLLGTWYRFGYKRNLTFVSPVGSKMYLNWPYPMTPLDFRPSSVGYNILTEHSIYTPDVMEAIMPNDTVFLTILRYPFEQVQSMFQYFKVAQIAGIRPENGDVFVQYFSNLRKNEAHFQRPNAPGRDCIPTGFSMTKNLMSHCLGMPLGFPTGRADISKHPDRVDEYIQFIDQKFDLIMIVEYFYESLILLRRMMCWKFNDLLFVTVNVARYGFDTKNVPERVKNLHKQWSSIDYKLYNYFNQTFWKKMAIQSDDFYDEVAALREMSDKVQVYCWSLVPFGERPYYRYPWAKQWLTIPASNWTSEFKIFPEDCWMLAPDPYKLYKKVQLENNVDERELLEKQRKIHDSRTRDEKCLC